MKKHLSLILTLLLAFSLTACSKKTAQEPTPEQVVENALGALQEYNPQVLTECFGVDILSTEVAGASLSTIYQAAFAKLQFNIISFTEQGTSATVTAEITVIDMNVVARLYLLEQEEAPADADSETTEATEEDYIRIINAEGTPTYTQTVTFTLEKVNGIWIILYDEPMAVALFGLSSVNSSIS